MPVTVPTTWSASPTSLTSSPVTSPEADPALGLVLVGPRETAALREQREDHVIEPRGVAVGLVDRVAPNVAVRRHPQRPGMPVGVLADDVGRTGDRAGALGKVDGHRLLGVDQ